VSGGLFTVGDIGYLDEDGWLSLRRTDLILSGGVNVYPAEVEAVLLAHPEVADAAVIGVPDQEWGQRVTAVVQPEAGVAAGDELAGRLIEHCRTLLAGFKIPRVITFTDRLPRTQWERCCGATCAQRRRPITRLDNNFHQFADDEHVTGRPVPGRTTPLSRLWQEIGRAAATSSGFSSVCMCGVPGSSWYVAPGMRLAMPLMISGVVEASRSPASTRLARRSRPVFLVRQG